MSVSLSTEEVEVEVSVEELEKILRRQIPNVRIQDINGELYVVVPVKEIVPIKYRNGKILLTVPVPKASAMLSGLGVG